MHFNSSMVRLKECLEKVPGTFCIDFNSSMVRLKEPKLRQKKSWISKFQFQYGAIESFKSMLKPFSTAISIPVWCDWKWMVQLFCGKTCNFNSSMVRLKAGRSSFWNRPWPPFQFQYGAIESLIPESVEKMDFISIPVWCDWKIALPWAIANIHAFQFQYGAIESCNENYHNAAKSYFNSSMVRLKGYDYWGKRNRSFISIPVWCDWKLQRCKFRKNGFGNFNSSMVRLKEGAGSNASVTKWYFNSSMVRLKAGLVDKSVKSFIISIPVWCDWKCLLTAPTIRLFTISIPVWCDWKTISPHVNSLKSSFQFQYGAIERDKKLIECSAEANFNSSMVRLKVRPMRLVHKLFLYFNSSMVRLKVSLPKSSTNSLIDFNSSMVRLKGGTCRKLSRLYANFNSSMVRLKVC